MRTLSLLAGAACACAAVPAIAQSQSSGPQWSGNDSHWSSRHDGNAFRHDPRAGQFHNGGNTAVVLESDGGQWAAYNNRSWDSNSFNDWWHDRPDRAFPRWVQHNQNCSPDRMWWSGSGWHC